VNVIGLHRVEADACSEITVKEAVMGNKAERWLAEQEIAFLERIYTLESPPEHEDTRQVIEVEAHRVRRATNPSQKNGTITG
jgi:hypothetical protein